MNIQWTSKALSDVVRLHEFLVTVDPEAAARTVQKLSSAPLRLPTMPRIGEKLERFSLRDVRRILVGNYEIRYEIRKSTIAILRIWHTREVR